PQAIGTLTVVGVQARTSTALVINSQHEFTVGSPVESAVTKQDSHTPSAWEQLMARVATLSIAIPPCLERARQAVRTAEMTGASRQDLAAATNTLAYATSTFQQAQEVLNQGKREQALALLEAAQSDCLTAQQLANQAGIRVASRTPPSLDSYTVQRGDTLWDISALELIYRNPLLWPILYKANRDHIRDPDVIVPTQTLTVPRSYTPEEATAALRRARARGPWQLGDGPDFYVLEGVRP
ncbi:MAG: LysM peptidoglycan-binding domain-containing protein, partial [Candidatus Tectomicrobia bacterium]